MTNRNIWAYVRDVKWYALGFEFVIVAAGIVLGFQVTQWGESQDAKELAAQNLTRAIAEVQFNTGLLDRAISGLEKDSILIESALTKLIACDEAVSYTHLTLPTIYSV